jgi:drug/metabolite transporter (DMT)-like permease
LSAVGQRPPAAGRPWGDLLRLHLAVAGFGFAGLCGKLIHLEPVAIVAGRAGFAALAIAAAFCLGGRARDLLPRGRRQWLGPALGLVLAAHWWTFFQAIQVASVAIGLVSFSTSPILLLLMEALWYRRRPGVRALLASLAALAGVLLAAPSLRWADASLRGMLWGVLSGGLYALLVLLARPLVAELSSWRLALWQNAVAALVLVPFLAGGRGPDGPGQWALLALLGVLLTAGTHGLFLRSMRTVPAHLAVLTCSLEPAYGIIAAAAILGERPAGRTLLGAALIAAAVAYTTWSPRRRR